MKWEKVRGEGRGSEVVVDVGSSPVFVQKISRLETPRNTPSSSVLTLNALGNPLAREGVARGSDLLCWLRCAR